MLKIHRRTQKFKNLNSSSNVQYWAKLILSYKLYWSSHMQAWLSTNQTNAGNKERANSFVRLQPQGWVVQKSDSMRVVLMGDRMRVCGGWKAVEKQVVTWKTLMAKEGMIDRAEQHFLRTFTVIFIDSVLCYSGWTCRMCWSNCWNKDQLRSEEANLPRRIFSKRRFAFGGSSLRANICYAIILHWSIQIWSQARS